MQPCLICGPGPARKAGEDPHEKTGLIFYKNAERTSNMKFELCNLSVEQGQKVQGFIELPFTTDRIPCTLIYGEEDGETALVEGGLHNAEYVGIETAIGLAGMLEPSDIRGKLIIIHLLNVNGFRQRTVSVCAEDGKNLNRVFPGNPDGTYADKMAYFMEKEIYPKIDYFIDVHNGDWFEDLVPFIYAVGKAPEETVKKAEEMAKAADVPFFVRSSGTSGAYNHAGVMGIPSVLLERGCMGNWTREEVEASQKDVRNILRRVGILISERFHGDLQRNIPRLMPHSHYVDSDKEGCWFPMRKAGDMVEAGELVGVIKDFFGNTIDEIRFDEDCMILYQTVSYSLPKNTPLVAYGHYEDCIETTGDHHRHAHTHPNPMVKVHVAEEFQYESDGETEK